MSNPDPARPPATPAVASAVVLVRDGEHGLEVFCVERHRENESAPTVGLPGGRVERDDLAKDWNDVVLPVHPRSEPLAATPAQRLAVAIAAARLTLEQAAVLPVNGPLTHSAAVGLRRTLAGSVDAFRSALDARGLRIDLTSIVPFFRWVTPEAEARRFDTRVFMLRAPAGQDGLDRDDRTATGWATPADLVDRSNQQKIVLEPLTHWVLGTLSPLGNVDAAVAVAETSSLAPISAPPA
ncbi:MAG: hypothetical protein R2752_00875 [Vicinamibacterales bacterium]